MADRHLEPRRPRRTTIRRNVVVDGKLTIRDSKTGSKGKAILHLDPGTVEILAAWRRDTLEDHMAAGFG